MGLLDFLGFGTTDPARKARQQAAYETNRRSGKRPLQGPPQFRPLQGDERRQNPDGSYSTEITRTDQDPQGRYRVHPSLWMGPNGQPIEAPEEGSGLLADMYEQFGYEFPRFGSLQESEDWATARSKQGGVGTGPLAKIKPGAKEEERFLAEQRLGGLSEALLGGPDMLNTFLNAGIRDVDYFTGGGLSGGKYDPYQLPMASAAVNDFAAKMREQLSGTKQIDPSEMPGDIQQQAANQRALFGMVPTGAEDVATAAVPAAKAMFLGLKKAGTPEEAEVALDALTRLAMGEDPATIWKQSGWAVDPIQKYPYTEISDRGMRIKPAYERDLFNGQRVKGKLGDIVDHPELFKAYPGLADVNVDLSTGPFGGFYSQDHNLIKGQAPTVVREPTNDNLHSLLAHEIQHIIQRTEGWPRGSNMKAGEVVTPEIQKAMDTVKAGKKKRRELYRTYLFSTGQKSADAYADWQEIDRVLKSTEEYIKEQKAFQYYKRQPGEVQARNTSESRFNYTERERRDYPAEETMDVPVEEQVKTFGTRFGPPRSPVLAAPEPGGVLGEIEQSFRPGKKPTKAEREAAEMQSLREEATGLFNMSATPNVPQTQIPRFTPPKGVPQRILDLTSSPEVRKLMLEKIAAGKEMGANKWYNMEPLRQAFIEEFDEVEGSKRFNKYLDYVAGSSPKSTVPENIRNASYYYGLDVKGEPLPEPYTTPEGKVIKNPEPYGHLAQDLHRINFEKIRSGKGLDTKTNPKPLGFVEDLKGNLTPVAVDAHAYRLPAMLSQDPRFLETSLKTAKGAVPRNIMKEFEEGKISMQEALAEPTYWQGKPKENEYEAMEKYYQSLAEEAGLLPGEGQASAWVGGGKLTGLKSDETKTGMQLFIDRLAYTAQKRGEPVKKVLKDMMRGDNALLTLAGFGLLPLLYEQGREPQGGVLNEVRKEQ